MKKYLILLVALVIVVPAFAQTEIGTIDWNALNLKSKVLRSLNADDDETYISYSIALVEYRRYTDSTTREVIGSIDIDSDLNKRVGTSLNVELVPVNKLLKKWLGTDGSITIPIITKLVDNFVQLSVTVGESRNFDTNKWETFYGLTVIQRKF